MSWIVCWATKNVAPKRDATGAFIPEAGLVMDALEEANKRFLTVEIDNLLPRAKRADALFECLEGIDWLEGLVYLGHGLSHSAPSLGIELGKRHSFFVQAMARAAGSTSLTVVFYACSMADGPRKGIAADAMGMDNGFADVTRDQLCKLGLVNCRVWAHTTSAHTTKNPDLAVFEGFGSPIGGVGGRLLAPRGGALRSRFVKAMRTPGLGLRHRLPLLTPQEVVKEAATWT